MNPKDVDLVYDQDHDEYERDYQPYPLYNTCWEEDKGWEAVVDYPPLMPSIESYHPVNGHGVTGDVVVHYEQQINKLTNYIYSLYNYFEDKQGNSYTGRLERKLSVAAAEAILLKEEVAHEKCMVEKLERSIELLEKHVLTEVLPQDFLLAFMDRCGGFATEEMARIIGKRGDIVIHAKDIDQEFFSKMHDLMFDLGFQLIDRTILPSHLHF